MNEVLAFGGKPIVTPSRAVLRDWAAGAPVVGGVAVRLVAGVVGEVETAEALPPEVLGARVVWATADDSRSWPVPDTTLALMKAGAGTFPLAAGEALLGRLYGHEIVSARLVLRFPEGEATAAGPRLEEPPGYPDEPFVLLAPPAIIGDAVEGEPLSVEPPEYTGDEGVGYVLVVGTAATGDDPEPTTIEVVGGICPGVVDDQAYLYVGAAFFGPGTPEDIVWAPAGVAITPAEPVETPVSVSREPIVASNRVTLTARAGDDPEPGDTLTAGEASATIVGFEPVLGVAYLGTITSGPISGAATWPGGSGTASASEPWAYVAGEPFFVLPPEWDGTPGAVAHVQQYADDSESPAKSIDLAGTFPKWLGTRYYRELWDWSAPGVEGVQRTAAPWLPIGAPTLDPIPAEDWHPIVEAEGAATRLVGIWLHEGHVVDEGYLTTSTDERLEAIQFPTDHEPTTPTAATTVIEGRTFVRRDTGTWVHGGTDYALFTDNSRRHLLAVTCLIGGVWTPLSARKTVPLVDDVPVDGLSVQERWTMRTQAQAQADQQGGTCMQFPRAADTDGDYIITMNDIGQLPFSTNAAEDWQIDHADGLYASQTTSGLCVDGKYVHVMAGALWMEALGNHDAKAGIYRMNRETGKWSLTRALSKVHGSNDGVFRACLRYIAKVAGSGSGPDTRTLFALYAPAAAGTGAGGLSTFQVYKSTNGGASWATDGSTMTASTYGVPFEMWADATALYLNTEKGVWRRPFGGTTWTKATGLASGRCYHLEKHGSTVYVCVAGQGLYKASDATTLAFTRIYQGNVIYFAISPHDTNRRVLIRANGAAHLYTTQGDTGWTTGSTLQFPGQPNNFAHQMSGSACWVRWHTTNPNILYAMRFQHPGKSENGGQTFRWASKNNDYSEVRDIAVSPSSPDIMALAATDRLFFMASGPHFTVDSEQSNKNTMRADADAALGVTLNAHTASGVLFLERGTHRRVVGQLGRHTQAKTLCVSIGAVTTTETDKAATGNGAISVSATGNFPPGVYTLACTTGGGNGVGKFRGTGPMFRDMGEWTVGTQRVWNHPWGGSITVTIADGSVDHKAGSNPKVFTIDVNPIYDFDVLNPDGKTSAQVGETNPAVPYRGITGRHVVQMDTDGNVSVIRLIPYQFLGYMGPSGDVILASSGSSTLMRSADEGVTWTTFASSLGNFQGLSFPVAIPSRVDALRGWAGLSNARLVRIQNGVKTTVFDLDAWLTARGITTNCPGTAQVNGRWVPPIVGVTESAFDPNLVHIALYTSGDPYTLFRSQNALAATPEWENITFDALDNGMPGPIQRLRIHPGTDEPIICSAAGTVWVDLPEGFRAANNITRSMIADTRAMPGYASFTKRI